MAQSATIDLGGHAIHLARVSHTIVVATRFPLIGRGIGWAFHVYQTPISSINLYERKVEIKEHTHIKLAEYSTLLVTLKK